MAWWNLLFAPVTGIIKAGSELGKQWMEGKQKKHELNMAIKDKQISGQIDYNVEAQKGMAASWKDEWLVIFTCAWITACFIPSLQPTMKSGFEFLKNSTPDWFSFIICGMYVAVFGLKGWKIFKE